MQGSLDRVEDDLHGLADIVLLLVLGTFPSERIVEILGPDGAVVLQRHL